MNLRQTKDFFNLKPVEYVVRENYNLIEDNEFIPRFSLKNVKDIANIPINEPIKYSDEVMIKAIKYGMIFLINYKGEEDSHFAGHERVVYPLVLGRSSKGKTLLRGWHLNGWSVSNNRHINKIWRLFRTDRILLKETDTQLDLTKALENTYINNTKDQSTLRLSFLKSIYGNTFIAILGAMGQPGNTVKVKTDKGKELGNFKVLDSITGQVLKSIKNVKGNTLYDLYLYDKKL